LRALCSSTPSWQARHSAAKGSAARRSTAEPQEHELRRLPRARLVALLVLAFELPGDQALEVLLGELAGDPLLHDCARDAFGDVGGHGHDAVVLVDVLQPVVDAINRGESHIQDVPSGKLAPLVGSGAIVATTDFAACADAAAIVIAVPTPLSPQREPDVGAIEAASSSIAPHLRAGHLVVLESTTYPGTTRDHMGPMLEAASGLVAGTDFHLAMSPDLFKRYAQLSFWRDLKDSKAFRIVSQPTAEKQRETMPEPVHSGVPDSAG
jgi:hypothetical protein